MKKFSNLRIALVYDRVNKFGGAERILLALHRIWPQAPLYTSVYDRQGAPWTRDFQVIPSWLQKIPGAKKHHEFFPWLMPLTFEQFNFKDYDLVISVTSAEAKGVMTQPKTLHLCYCLTPTRYLWSSYKHYLKNPRFGLLNPLAMIFLRPMLSYLKKWDQVASQRPDHYLAISQTVQKRIKKYYHRDAEIIYPPVDVNKFKPTRRYLLDARRYFLVVSRLVSYKRVDIIVEAFNQLGLPLKIIGDGTERKRLEKKAKSNIEFLGQDLTDEQLINYYQECLALVFGGQEDFGLVSLEAQACQKPVIAYKMGGIAETVIDGRTGILFARQTTADLIKAIKKFDPKKFKGQDCRQNALKYSQEKFKQKFASKMEELWQQHQKAILK
jgi:glycosyltransferase involved in cell wall biosynthesis